MKVYKATDKDMKCRGLQYEIGKTVEAEGELKLCENGLHACEAPLELFDYYSPADGSRYFEAEAEDVSDERSDNESKIVARKLTLGAEIGIPGLVKAHIEYVKAHTTSEHTDHRQATAGSYGAATAGDSGAATSRGRSASGENGLSVCRGNNVKAKGGLGALLVIAIENDNDYKIKEWIAVVVDGKTVKADTWYTLKNGEFVEVQDAEGEKTV